MNVEYFISKRLFFAKKENNRYTRPILFIGTLAITLSVAIMLLSIMITNGFRNQITDKIIGFGGDITITNFTNNQSYESVPISIDQDFYPSIADNEGISNISIFATKAGIIQANNEILGVVLKGISTDFDWKFFKQNMIQGDILNIEDSITSNEILISSEIARLLDVSIGESLFMYFAQDPPRVRKFKIKGVYSTALADFDKLFVISDIKHIQKLNKWNNNQIGGFEIKIHDFDKLDIIAEYIYESIGIDLKSESIKERFPELFDWLELQNMNVILIITLMMIVGLVNMITVLLIIILERIRLIGVLKSLGLSNWRVRKVFLYQALQIAFKGILYGNLIAFLFAFLQVNFSLISLDPDIYYMDYVPVDFDLASILMVNTGTLILCYLTLIIPSLIITNMRLIKTIRFE